MSRKSEGATAEKKTRFVPTRRTIGEKPQRVRPITVSVKGFDDAGEKSGLVLKIHGKSLSEVLDAVTGAVDGEG